MRVWAVSRDAVVDVENGWPCVDVQAGTYYVAAYDARWRLAIIASVHPSIAASNSTRRCHPCVPTSYGAKYVVRKGGELHDLWRANAQVG